MTFRCAALWAALCLVSGCDARDDIVSDVPVSVVPREHQSAALAIVWKQTWFATDDPPIVRWVESLDCSGGFKVRGECVAGYTLDGQSVTIAWWSGARLSETGLCHELWHAFLSRATGTTNPTHTDPGFAPGGAVDKAREALRAAGL